MSFAKAQDLLRLAQMASMRRSGVSLVEIMREFEVSHRTAQRMTHALEASFANVTWDDDDEMRRRWRIEDPRIGKLRPRQELTVEALEIAVREARSQNRQRHARALEEILDMITASLGPGGAVRAEADAEAVLTTLAHAARPGPKVRLRPGVMDAVIEALRGPFRLCMVYREAEAKERIVEPHGVLFGARTYLVARQPSRSEKLIYFRLDRIFAAACTEETFAFEPGFSIEEFAARAFGAHQTEGQYGEVVWRFAAEAVERATEFQFHPHQQLEPQEDGSLIVRFHAAGWLEMAWHLYQWGDKVEVLAPEGLRLLTEGYRRADFDGLP